MVVGAKCQQSFQSKAHCFRNTTARGDAAINKKSLIRYSPRSFWTQHPIPGISPAMGSVICNLHISTIEWLPFKWEKAGIMKTRDWRKLNRRHWNDWNINQGSISDLRTPVFHERRVWLWIDTCFICKYLIAFLPFKQMFYSFLFKTSRFIQDEIIEEAIILRR